MTERPYEPTLNDIYAPNSIYLRPPNKYIEKYGYQIAINHTEIRPHYEKFKEEMKIPPWCPLGRAERIAFEQMVLCGYYLTRLKRT